MLQNLKELVLIHLAPLLTPNKDVALSKEVFRAKEHLKISFCTTCMGRTIHLKKTYKRNILENLNYPNIEFILVNYNSRDGMEEWVKEEIKPFIDDGIVKYYKTPNPKKFNASKAKNLAHRLATGDIVVNLDADNFLGKNAAFYINHKFINSSERIILFFFKSDFRFFDTCGRIALRKDDFINIGGYREDLLPFKGQDMDLIKRLEQNGLKTVIVKHVNFLRTIKHDDKLRSANLESSLSLKEMHKANTELTMESLKKNDLVANKNGFHSYEVYENFEEEPIKI